MLLSTLPIAALLAAAAPGVEDNQPPFCEDQGVFVTSCQGTASSLLVDLPHYDPDGDPLSYQWFSCPGSWLTDPTSPTTTVVVDTSESCDRICGVRLRIADPFGGSYVCRLYVQVVPGAEGCTPGYWKNHIDSWADTGFSPSDDFDTVFGVDAFTPDRTLLQALQSGGGGLNKLGRHGTAALLNSSDGSLNGDVHFRLSVGEVITLVHDAIVNHAYEPIATQFDTWNNGGCPQN